MATEIRAKDLRADFVPFHIEQGGRIRREASTEPKLTREERLLSRDLSWLMFNDRVLSEAGDPSVPALERLRFCTIVSSNLDEFFMVRVAEIAKLARRYPRRRFPDGLTMAQTLAQVREGVLQQKARQALVLDGVLETLRKEGIHILKDFEKEEGLDFLIEERIPPLAVCLRRSSEPLPPLPSGRICVFVRFPGEYAILRIEEREKRLMELPASDAGLRYALAERWLCARAGRIFAGREVIEAFPFKLIRDADLRYHPEDEETLEEQIVEAVERRKKAKVVRLEVDAPDYSEGALFLATALGLDSAGLYRFDLPLDLRTMATLYRLEGKDDLRYPPVEPAIPPPLRDGQGIFEAVKKRDILLHHPYDSFEIVVRFLEAAAVDPGTRGIFHTVYRTSRESPTLQALQKAAKAGKRPTAYVEIKARFDELNNVRWADALRKAGGRVVRPLGRFKVHSKLTRVVRREGAQDVSYVHLGTGNYHPMTARQYTDLGLLTSDERLGREVAEYFKALQAGRKPRASQDLLVAPGNLQEGMLRLIRRETQLQRDGQRGRILAKMNSLADPVLIEALYEASQAGVSVELMVRGICCLIPGIKGLSENIRVVSVIDRFLEHSRIYYFHSGGEERMYLSSADWMPRNFFTRYEIAFAVKDSSLKKYIRDVVLSAGLADNVKAWQLKPDGTYSKVQPPEGAPQVRSQMLFEALARKGYRDTALADR